MVDKSGTTTSDRPGRKRIWRLCATLAVAVSLIALALVGYLFYLRKSAEHLIDSVREVRTTADARRVMAASKSRFGAHFWQESDHIGGDHDYDGQIDNGFPALFRICEPTAITVGFTMHDGELRGLVVIMTTGRKQTTTASVLVQEWFEPDPAGRVHVSTKDRPRLATVEFSASVDSAQRDKVFAFNTNCFVRLGGCKSAEDILPGVWLLDPNVRSTNE